jgi:hypothetical protein
MRYSLIDKQIKRLLGRADEALLRALSISPVFGSGGHGSGVSDKVGCGLAEYDCYIGQANELIDKLYEVKKDIVNVLKLMPDVRYRTLLYLRYIKLLPWDKIAYRLIKTQNMACDEIRIAQYVVEVRTNLHKAALKSFAKYCIKL